MVKDSKILILGFTFKENCPDIRNTKIIDIYSTLSEYTGNITVYDPWANAANVRREYGIDVINEIPGDKYDAVILAVAHSAFEKVDIMSLVRKGGVVYDVKGVLPREIVDDRL